MEGEVLDTDEFVVWVDAENKLASFHEMNGLEKKRFPNKERFMDFLQQLSQQHYRFT